MFGTRHSGWLFCPGLDVLNTWPMHHHNRIVLLLASQLKISNCSVATYVQKGKHTLIYSYFFNAVISVLECLKIKKKNNNTIATCQSKHMHSFCLEYIWRIAVHALSCFVVGWRRSISLISVLVNPVALFHNCPNINGQVRLGGSVRNYFSVRTQFWIRLAAVSYRGKKVQTVVSPVVRSVNKSHDIRNCVQSEPEYAICVHFGTHLY